MPACTNQCNFADLTAKRKRCRNTNVITARIIITSETARPRLNIRKQRSVSQSRLLRARDNPARAEHHGRQVLSTVQGQRCFCSGLSAATMRQRMPLLSVEQSCTRAYITHLSRYWSTLSRHVHKGLTMTPASHKTHSAAGPRALIVFAVCTFTLHTANDIIVSIISTECSRDCEVHRRQLTPVFI